MKNIYKTILCALAMLSFASCNNDDIVPDTPDTPTAECHLRFSGSVGSDKTTTRASWTDNNDGKLTFAWDYTLNPETATESEMKMAFVKDGNWLKSIEGNDVVDVKILRHSDPEKAEDGHWAEFETIDAYEVPVLEENIDGHTLFAVTPVNDDNGSSVKIEDGSYHATLVMPTEFTQSGKNNLAHLSNYMYMWCEDDITDGTASLLFFHVSSYIRFKVYNWRGTPATIYGVKMEVVDASGEAVPASGISAHIGEGLPAYRENTDNSGVKVSFAASAGETIENDEAVFLYAPVFPTDNSPTEGNTIRISVIADDPTNEAAPGEYHYYTFELSGSTLYQATHSFDWITGDLYTFHLYLDDVVRIPEVTVVPWTEREIQGGEAEEDEWRNGINIYTGAYQPATLNAEGAYEIGNAGNLMWFDQLATASDVDNTALNAVLTADVDLEGFKWAALGRSSDKPYMGTFDGRGHTISNLSRNAHSNEGSRESFVYYLGGKGVIKNVTFDKADVFCQGHAGANASAVVALRSAGTISCCVVSNTRVQLGNYEYLSGIAGVNNGTIENCAVINTSLTRRFGHSHPSAPITHNNQGTVSNCFAYGCTQSANNAANGGIVVSCSTAPANCYYYTTSSVSDAYGTAKTPEEFASATMAELLNGDQENGPWEYVAGNDYPTLKK